MPFVRSGNMLTVSGQLCLDVEGKIVAKGQLGGAGPSRTDKRRRGFARSTSWLRSRPRSATSTKSCGWCGLAASSIRPPDFRRPEGHERRLRRDGRGVRRQGQTCRSTVGVAALPADAAVEVEGLFEVS